MLKNTSVEELMLLCSNNFVGFKDAVNKILVSFYSVPKEREEYFKNINPLWNYLRAFTNQYKAWNSVSAKSSIIAPIEYHFENAYNNDLIFQKMVQAIDQNISAIKQVAPSITTSDIGKPSLIFYLTGKLPQVYKRIYENMEGFINQFINYSDKDYETKWQYVKWNRSNITEDAFYKVFESYIGNSYQISINQTITEVERQEQLKKAYAVFISSIATEEYKLDLINAKYLDVLARFKSANIPDFADASTSALSKQVAFLEKLQKKEVAITYEMLNEKIGCRVNKSDKNEIDITIQYSIQPEYFEKAEYDTLSYKTLPIIIDKKIKQGLSEEEYRKQALIKVYLTKRTEFKYNIADLQSDNSRIVMMNCVLEAIASNKPVIIEPIPEKEIPKIDQLNTEDCIEKVRQELQKDKVAAKTKFKNVEAFITGLIRELKNKNYSCKDISINPDDKDTPHILVCILTFTDPIFEGTSKNSLKAIQKIMNDIKTSDFYFDRASVLPSTDNNKLAFLIRAYLKTEKAQQEEEKQETQPKQKELVPTDPKRFNYNIPTIPALRYQSDDTEPEDIPDEFIPSTDEPFTKIEDIEPEPPAWYERTWFVWGLVGLALSLAVLTIYLTRKNKKRVA